MEKIQERLIFARKNNKTIKIETKNKKYMYVKIYGYENNCILYKFWNSDKLGKINYSNIVNVSFTNQEDEKEFIYDWLSTKYKTPTLREKIENFEKYYMEIIEELLREGKNNLEREGSLENKKKVYPQIFKNLSDDEENLLLYYFAKKAPNKTITVNTKKGMLLIEQANISQKKALANALKERISIIEGPPGTGKTTTILNILANLIYRNQKVLVVSKNNSAIENVLEELEKIDIPKCYVRMRKLRYNEK